MVPALIILSRSRPWLPRLDFLLSGIKVPIRSGMPCNCTAGIFYCTELSCVCFQNLLVLVVSEYASALEVLTLVCSSTLKFVKCSSSSKVQNFSCFFCGLPVQAHSDRFPNHIHRQYHLGQSICLLHRLVYGTISTAFSGR